MMVRVGVRVMGNDSVVRVGVRVKRNAGVD